jgi:tetratricopeptide (TPR) repeat protein
MRHSLLIALLLLASLPASPQAQTAIDDRKRAEAQQAYARGVELMRSESFEEAATAFQGAIRLDPLHTMAYYNLGQSRMALKEYPAAVRAYEGCRQALERISMLSVDEKGEREQAREDEVRELKDSLHRVRSGQLKVSASRILQMEVQLEERLRFLEGARMRGNEHLVAVPAELMLALGSAHFRSGQLAAAEQAYTAAVKTDAKLGAAHNNLAVIYMLSGRFAEASQAVTRAEKAGFKVSSAFKSDLEQRARSAAPAQ